VAKVLIEFQVDAKGGVEAINRLKESLGSIGVEGKVVDASLSQQDAAYKRLINTLEPARVATERFAKQQELLKHGLDQNLQGSERYAAQLRTLQQNFDQAGGPNGIQKLVAGFQSLQGAIMGAATMMAAKKLVGGLMDLVEAYGEAEVSATRIGAVIRASGGAAGYTAEQMLKMASQMQKLTGTSDETVQGAQAVLLTFQNIGHEAFPRTLTAAADLAAVMGTDLQSAVRSLGMALENPEQGMLRLRRAGIMLSEQTKTTIKDLWEQGQTLEAQNMLLAEVEKRVKGAAEALGNTFVGSLNKTRAALNDVKEEMGGFLLQSSGGTNTLNDLAVVLGKIADTLKEIRGGPGSATGAAGGLGLTQAIFGATPFGAALGQFQQLQLLLNLIAGKMPTAGVAPGLVSSHGEGPSVAGGTLDAAAAWKKIEAAIKDAIKAQDKFLEGERKVTDASLEILKAVGTNMVEGLAGAFSGRYAAGGGFGIGTDRTFSDFAVYAGKNFGLVMGQEIPGGIVDGLKQGIPELGGMSDEMAREFGEAFRDGFLTIFQGGDFKDAWKGLWTGLAGMAAQSFGGIFTSLMKGESPDLVAAGITKEGGGVNWGGVAMMGGGLLASYGQAKQNRGLAAAGGAIAGAGMAAGLGATLGGSGLAGPIGLIIGALVLGVMAYFSSGGPKQYGYNIDMSRRVGGLPFLEMGGGTGPIQEREMARQLMDRQLQVSSAFRDLLRDMNVSIDKLPLILTAWKGNTADLNAVFSAILKGELPRAVFAAYRDLLAGGLTGIGVSGGRAGQLLGAFDTGDFDKALASLQAYVAVLMKLQSLTKDLSKDLVTLQDELSRTVRETWMQTVEDTLEQIAELSEGLDQLTSDEQVARAQQIADLAQQQYEANLQYLQNIYQAQKEISQSWEDMFLGFREAEAGEQGPEAQKAFYRTQLEKLQSQLAGAGSVEELQRIMQMIQQAGMALWRLGGTQEAGMYDEAASTREWVEQFLRDQQAAADLLFTQWAEEVKAQNEALRLAIVGITDALTGENGLQKGLSGFKAGLDDTSGGLARLRLAAEDAAGALGDLGGGGVEPGYRRGA
jgi:hypothetical protein